MGRGVMGVLAGIGVLIALGLVLSNPSGTVAEVKAFGGVLDSTINDLKALPKAGTH